MKRFALIVLLLAEPAAAGTIFSDRNDVANWSLWTHYAGGEDADAIVATSPPPVSGRPSISLACRAGNPVEGTVTLQINSIQTSKPAASVTVEFGSDNGAPMHLTAPVDSQGRASISGLGAVLEIALRLRHTQRLAITIDDARASFDVSGFQKIEHDFLEICTTTH